jgi:hypothetical protein
MHTIDTKQQTGISSLKNGVSNQCKSGGFSRQIVGIVSPEFINHHQATAIFGLHRSHLYQLVQAGKIKSVSLRERNKIKGKRLFIADSIREFLIANIEEFIQK